MKSLYYFETIESEKLITKLIQYKRTNSLLPTAPGSSLIFTYYNGQIGIYFLMDNMPNNVMIKWKKFRIPWYNKYKNITLYKLKYNSEEVYYNFHTRTDDRKFGWINFDTRTMIIPTNFNLEERELMMKLTRKDLHTFPPEFITKEQVLLL